MSTRSILIPFTLDRPNVEGKNGKIPEELSAEDHQNQIIYSPFRSLLQTTN
jgi:hypothetical protein